MGVMSTVGVLSVLACVIVCEGQINSYPSDLSSISRILQSLRNRRGGGQVTAPQFSNVNVQNVQRSEYTEVAPQQVSVAPQRNSNSYNRLLGLVASRWGSMEDRIERRLDALPDNVADLAEQRVDRASDYFDNVQEQQQRRYDVSNNWNRYSSDSWDSNDDYIDDRLDRIDDAVDNRIDMIENVYGDRAADIAENRWDATQDVIENTVDAVTDRFDDNDSTDDWGYSNDSNDDRWDSSDNNNWVSNRQSNMWNNNQNNNWGRYSSFSF